MVVDVRFNYCRRLQLAMSEITLVDGFQPLDGEHPNDQIVTSVSEVPVTVERKPFLNRKEGGLEHAGKS